MGPPPFRQLFLYHYRSLRGAIYLLFLHPGIWEGYRIMCVFCWIGGVLCENLFGGRGVVVMTEIDLEFLSLVKPSVVFLKFFFQLSLSFLRWENGMGSFLLSKPKKQEREIHRILVFRKYKFSTVTAILKAAMWWGIFAFKPKDE